ncbi:hypothetical protein [Candidatus Nitronereus thalassa]|uniref:Uncharacterized protein n=1 Tax=Candidatus Nitronereus thalassa TaxID=3020898 RepID=A0ABU3K6D0_9BACT|nr:hypothetical protein [Candidatus Nitronereus thalassa]MDT7041984.1 hypothetical protein [Candidatus Nitronereus thalassa]
MIPSKEKTLLSLLFGILFLGLFISPSHAKLTLDTSLSVSEQYTDNLFFTFANKKDDFGTFVTPRLTLIFENKHVKLGGTYTASAQFYVNNSQANTVSQGMNLIIDLPFLNRISKKLEVRVNESFNFAPDQPAFSGNSNIFSSATEIAGGAGPAGGAGVAGVGAAGVGGAGVGGLGGIGGLAGNSLDNQGVFTQRTTTTFQNQARIFVGYALAPRWNANVQYTNIFRGGLQDSLTHESPITLSYRVSEKLKISGGYNFQSIEFSSGGATTAPGANGTATSHGVFMGTNYQLTPTIPIIANAGVSVTNTEVDTTRINFDGNAEITKNFPDGSIGLRVNQQIAAGGGVAASSTLNQNAVLTFQKSFTRLVGGFLHLGYSRNRSLAGPLIDLDSYQVRSGLNLALLRWLNAGITYSYVNQESGGQFGATAQTNQIFLGLTAIPETFTFFK